MKYGAAGAGLFFPTLLVLIIGGPVLWGVLLALGITITLVMLVVTSQGPRPR